MIYIFFFLACVSFIYLLVIQWRLLAIKGQLRNIRAELENTREQSYNKQLTISLLDTDVTELAKELNHNLDYQKSLKLRAEQSEKRLKQSISDIAHDLRTPLTVIKGNLQMFERHSSRSEQEQGYLDICQDKTDELKNMVDDFFEMSVLESDSTPAALSDVDVTNMLVRFIVENEAVIREKHLVPEIVLPAKSVIVKADEKMLLRMFYNLLNNVLKYAKDSFVISLKEQDGMCRITFANTMPAGMEPDIAHMFDRTYRGDGARHNAGAGLGLYIVKLLAEKQDMQVFSERENMQLQIHILMGLADIQMLKKREI